MSHHTHSDIARLATKSSELGLHDLWDRATHELGGNIVLEFSREVIEKLVCPECGEEELIFAALGSVPYEYGKCKCSGAMRVVRAVHSYSGTEPYGNRRLSELGLPPFDLFVARNDERERAYLMCGDAEEVLGALATVKEYER